MTTPTPDPALSFGQAAAHYDAIRPTYPPAAIRWAIGQADGGADSVGTVVDLGAGTGLLTRAIQATTSASVVAVEPDPGMRTRLASATDGVAIHAGSAESIPLPDGAADAVLAGQAYHWFDTEKAHPEIARVVRPGGVFAPMWNIRDESVEWVAEYSRRVDGPAEDGHGRVGNGSRSGRLSEPDFGPHFGPVAREDFHHSVTMNADGLVALLASRSYYLTATPDQQAELRKSIDELAKTLPVTFEMPYVTCTYRAVRL